MAAADSLKITSTGAEDTGRCHSRPWTLEVAVVTVGSLQAGQTENIIPESAEIGVDFRSVPARNTGKDLVVHSSHR
ncbi:hypothetical protein VTO42DRAFT_5904 [Malbranchea cinnamomea]